jgi:hypothetical protein
LHTLLRLGSVFEIDGETLARAYRKTRGRTAAANAELEEFAAHSISDPSGAAVSPCDAPARGLDRLFPSVNLARSYCRTRPEWDMNRFPTRSPS